MRDTSATLCRTVQHQVRAPALPRARSVLLVDLTGPADSHPPRHLVQTIAFPHRRSFVRAPPAMDTQRAQPTQAHLSLARCPLQAGIPWRRGRAWPHRAQGSPSQSPLPGRAFALSPGRPPGGTGGSAANTLAADSRSHRGHGRGTGSATGSPTAARTVPLGCGRDWKHTIGVRVRLQESKRFLACRVQ